MSEGEADQSRETNYQGGFELWRFQNELKT
jgi:hypothetical protein